MKDSSRFDNVKTETELLREEFESKIEEFIDNAIRFCIKKQATGLRLSTLDKTNPCIYKEKYSEGQETDFEYKAKLEDIWNDERYSHFVGKDELLRIIKEYENEGVKLIGIYLYEYRFNHYYIDLDIEDLIKRKNV